MYLLPISREELRRQFPLTAKYAWFNTAAAGLVPQHTIDKMVHLWTGMYNPYSLGVPPEEPRPESVRSKTARLIGCSEDEVFFTGSTSHSMSVAAMSLPFQPKDQILIPEREFPAVVYPFMYRASRSDLDVTFVKWQGCGPTIDDIEAAFTPRTRAVCISWVQYQNGYTHDLVRIGDLCRDRGAWLVVDAIQGVGVVPIDVKKCNVSFLAAGDYKWLMAVGGIGITYVNRDIVDSMDPSYVSYSSVTPEIEDPDFRLDLRPGVGKFELTENWPGTNALGASLDFIESVGVGNINAHTRALSRTIVSGLKEKGYTVRTRDNEASPIVAFTTGTRVGDNELLAVLKARKIWTCVRDFGIRLAPHLYCTDEDVERLLAALPLR